MVCAALCALAFVISPAQASADQGVFGYSATFTLAINTSSASVVIPMTKANIKDVYLWCPTLDSGDTATMYLTQTISAVSTVVPRGWSDKSIGATSDNAIIRCNTNVLDIYGDGNVTVTVTTSTAQAAARTFKVLILGRHK
jgi:hypothetical protein